MLVQLTNNLSIRFAIIGSILFSVALTSFGQETRSNCPQVTLVAPDHSYPWNAVRISAKSLESAVKGDWLIVKENYRSKKIHIEKIVATESVEVNAWQTNDSGLITAVVAIHPSLHCANERYSAVSIVLMEDPGSPLIIDVFGLLPIGEEKSRLEMVVEEMQKRPKHELLIFVRFRRAERGSARVRRLQRILTQISGIRKLPIKGITFLLNDADTFSIEFQSVLSDVAEAYDAKGDYLVLKAEKLGEFKRLFTP